MSPHNILYLADQKRVKGKLSKLPIEANDVILLHLNEQLTQNQFGLIVATLREKYPQNSMLVVPKGVTIETMDHDLLIRQLREARKKTPTKSSALDRIIGAVQRKLKA
jgi:hypothetical protein